MEREWQSSESIVVEKRSALISGDLLSISISETSD